MEDSNDPNQECQKCPKSAQCPNRGPPIFETSVIEVSLSIEGDPDDLDAIVASLAASLGIDPSLIVVGDVTEVQRRGSLQIFLQIFAGQDSTESIANAVSSPDLVSALASDLASKNISASVTPTMSALKSSEKREGEVWEMRGGVYVLTECPSGFLLVNSTLDTQVCVCVFVCCTDGGSVFGIL